MTSCTWIKPRDRSCEVWTFQIAYKDPYHKNVSKISISLEKMHGQNDKIAMIYDKKNMKYDKWYDSWKVVLLLDEQCTCASWYVIHPMLHPSFQIL